MPAVRLIPKDKGQGPCLRNPTRPHCLAQVCPGAASQGLTLPAKHKREWLQLNPPGPRFLPLPTLNSGDPGKDDKRWKAGENEGPRVG